jgi:ABC-type uncharacterized transport system substrate-binding protein
LLPAARRVAALVNAPDPFAKPFLDTIRNAGEVTGVTIEPVMINHFEEIDAAFAAIAQNRPDAITAQSSLPLQHIAELSLKYRLPAVSTALPFAEAGGLMSYWFDEATLYRQTAVFVDKISSDSGLRGQDIEGREAGRSPGRAAGEIRSDHQPEDRQGARYHRAATATCTDHG